MEKNERETAPNPIDPAAARDRQLTWGECIALKRWIQQDIAADQAQTVGAYIRLLDTLPVCTTCGWSEALHTGEAHGASDHFVCAHFVHRPVDNFSR